jgi:hypothetical protein
MPLQKLPHQQNIAQFKTKFLDSMPPEQQSIYDKARAGNEECANTIQATFKIYCENQAKLIEEERKRIAKENTKFCITNPEEAISQIENDPDIYYLSKGELALCYGIFTIHSLKWTKEKGTKFHEGCDYKGVSSKGFHGIVVIDNKKYPIEGWSYYDKQDREKDACNEAWNVLINDVLKIKAMA